MDVFNAIRLDHTVTRIVAQLEREYGQARRLEGVERARTAEALGVWHRCAVVDIGNGRLATVGPHGGGLLIHNLHDPGEVWR